MGAPAREGEGERYVGAPDDLKRTGHMISEAVYERPIGERDTFE